MSTVKNPDIIEKIISADSEERLKLIREHSEMLSVTDLNEISLKLVSNLTNSVELHEQKSKKKHEILKNKSEENRANINREFSSNKSTLVQNNLTEEQTEAEEIYDNKDTYYEEDTSIQVEDVNTEEIEIFDEADNKVEYDYTPEKTSGRNGIFKFLFGVIFASIIYIVMFFLVPDISMYAPIASWVVFALTDIAGKKTKSAMFGSVAACYMLSLTYMLDIYNEYSEGTLDVNATTLTPVIIMVSLLLITLVWQSPKKDN